MLTLYRTALRIRRAASSLAGNALTWLGTSDSADTADDVLAFRRADGFGCVVNFSARPVPLPPHDQLLLTSGPLQDGLLPPDTAAWLRIADKS
jgi:alpha-glucosidase